MVFRPVPNTIPATGSSTVSFAGLQGFVLPVTGIRGSTPLTLIVHGSTDSTVRFPVNWIASQPTILETEPPRVELPLAERFKSITDWQFYSW